MLAIILTDASPAAAASACDEAANDEIAAALATIERSVDPCGASAELQRVVEAFRGCWGRSCRVCVDRHRERNITERADHGQPVTIAWNPELRTQLEQGCGGDAAVRRDPVASLTHELVHAAQAVAGADFTETEAVRIENIYRRAHGLCQRTRYGDDPLPPALLVDCTPSRCACRPDAGVAALDRDTTETGPGAQTAGDVDGAGR